MADVIYAVEVQLGTKGTTDPLKPTASRLDDLDSKLGRISGAMGGVGSRLSDAFTGAVEAAGRLAITIGTLGAVAVGAGAAYGVALLNNELEKAQIGLAAVFSANGVSGTMEAGMRMSADLMAKIRKDAAELPGETSDLLNIFRNITLPGLRGGADIERLEKLAGNIMAAGSAAGIDLHMAAREAGQLLGGRAGAHNVLGSTLFGLTGAEAQKFNKLTDAKRLEVLEAGMAKYAPAIAVYGKSFDGLSSTLVDNAKKFTTGATAGLFDHVKAALADANGWFDANQDKTSGWASSLSFALTKAWDVGRAKIEEWWPLITSFADAAGHKIEHIWSRMQPMLTRMEAVTKALLSNPEGTFDTIGMVAAGYGALKLAPGAGKAMSGLLGAAGVGGGLAGAAGTAIVAGAAFDTYALIRAMQNNDEAAASMSSAGTHFSSAIEKIGKAFDTAGPAIDMWGGFVAGQVERLAKALDGGASVISIAVDAISQRFEFLNGLMGDTAKARAKNAAEDQQLNDEMMAAVRGRRSAMEPDQLIAAAARAAGVEAQRSAAKKGAGGGGGGATVKIDKVEITVSGNQDPSRIARIVHSELANLVRHPRASRSVQNFSASR